MIIRKFAGGESRRWRAPARRRRHACAARDTFPARRHDQRSLDELAEEFIRRAGRSTFKGYKGYPAATCLSTESMVVHGSPADEARETGHPLGRRRGDARRVRGGLCLDVRSDDPGGCPAAPRRLQGCAPAGSTRPASATRSAISQRPSSRSPRPPASASIRSLVGPPRVPLDTKTQVPNSSPTRPGAQGGMRSRSSR